MSRRGRSSFAAACGIALAFAACGATPPQAPTAQAKRLDVATSAISSECGLAFQLTAPTEPRAGNLAGVEAAANDAARRLATVYRTNAAWVYQGRTVAGIVSESLTMLEECGLHGAAAELRRRAAGR